jgi:hypothetical protein
MCAVLPVTLSFMHLFTRCTPTLLLLLPPLLLLLLLLQPCVLCGPSC